MHVKNLAQSKHSINTKHSRYSFILGSSHPNSLPVHQRQPLQRAFQREMERPPGSSSRVGPTIQKVGKMVRVTVPAIGLLKDPAKAPSSWEGEHIVYMLLARERHTAKPSQSTEKSTHPSRGHGKSVMDNWGDASQLATPSLCSSTAPPGLHRECNVSRIPQHSVMCPNHQGHLGPRVFSSQKGLLTISFPLHTCPIN